MNEFDLNRELSRMDIISNGSYKFTILKKCILHCKAQFNVDVTVIILKVLNDMFNTFTTFLPEYEREKEQPRDYFSDAMFESYFSFLEKYRFFTQIDVREQFELEYQRDFQRQIFNNWKNINDTDIKSKSFIEVFDDFHRNGLKKYPQIFMKKLGELKHLYRAQKGLHFNDYNRMIPWPPQTDNRWNPAGETFLYLGYNESNDMYDDTINQIEKTCFEELRLKEGEDTTVCCFKPTFKSPKIFNLCYEDVTYDEINYELNEQMQIKVNNDAKKILSKMDKGKEFSEEKLKNEILQQTKNTRFKQMNKKSTEIYLGKLFMKGIDEAVFLPLGEDDPERDAYKPFHLLSKYLINQGYCGVIYRSTRMNLLGLQGKNVVLFENKFAHYVKNTMRYYHYDGEKYIRVNNIPG